MEEKLTEEGMSRDEEFRILFAHIYKNQFEELRKELYENLNDVILKRSEHTTKMLEDQVKFNAGMRQKVEFYDKTMIKLWEALKLLDDKINKLR
jgi:hypothetical protein